METPPLPNRRRTDRIREICARILQANEDEFLALSAELQMALNENTLQLENRTTAGLLKWPNPPEERRSSKITKQ
ncbi:MAG TPA: hypothetical protein VJQ59_08005 [Candidatus Sulfotelmatobacter sp.]|nr:hypothetical protein [Candidatus Sulfotelmatobacter sp.]